MAGTGCGHSSRLDGSGAGRGLGRLFSLSSLGPVVSAAAAAVVAAVAGPRWISPFFRCGRPATRPACSSPRPWPVNETQGIVWEDEMTGWPV